MLPDGLLEMIEAEYVLSGRLDPQGLLQYVQTVEEDGNKYVVIDPHYEEWVKYLPERFHAPDKIHDVFTALVQARNWMWRQIQELIEDTELYHWTDGKKEYIACRFSEEPSGEDLLEWFRAEKKIMKILAEVPEQVRMDSYYF